MRRRLTSFARFVGGPKRPASRHCGYNGRMRRRKAAELESLRRDLGNLDSGSIDRLYGLEPVYEPGAAAAGNVLPEEFIAVRCPYCGERLETRVDLTAGEASYIEDCAVCCRPIEFQIERDERGALSAVRVQRLD